MTPMTEDAQPKGINTPMKKIKIFSISGIILGLAMVAAAQPPSPVTFSRAQIKEYFEIQEKLYPDDGNLFKKLTTTFSDKPTYTADEVTAITDPKVKGDRDYAKYKSRMTPRQGAPPVDSFSA